MAINRPATATSDIGERNSLAPGTGRYRTLLSNSEGQKKRGLDISADRMKGTANTNGHVDSPLVNGKQSTVGRPRKQRNPESDVTDIPIQPKERQSVIPTPIIRSGSFDWPSYLKESGASSVPTSHFIHVPLEIQNDCISPRLGANTPLTSSFKCDQCMEGIDPHHESLFCAFKIVEVVGRRLRLRFLGYPEKYDFWTTVDSPFLFPVGWCAHNKRRLQPPKGYSDREQLTFDWDAFLTKEGYTAVPRHLFRVSWDCPTNELPPHMFRVGHKLEAVDKRNPGIACVATVKDNIGDYILIHFDGWDSGFDQWAHITSELLHPVGYCEEKELVLSIPSEWSTRPTGFTWKQYLKETNSKPVPKEAFEKRPKSRQSSDQLQVGQRCEAVDKRCPQLIRVANIVANTPQGFLTIGYDGWAEKYNVCLEASSPDLFPAGYCQATGHPLQPPPGYESDNDMNSVHDGHSNSSTSSVNTAQAGACPTVGCKGYGHVKGPRYSYHQRVSGCPYADANLKRDVIRPHERLASSNIASPVPDSTSVPQMPRLEQAALSFNNTPAMLQDSISGPCLSPDSSVKTDPFTLSGANSPVLPNPTSHTCNPPRTGKQSSLTSCPIVPSLEINGSTEPIASSGFSVPNSFTRVYMCDKRNSDSVPKCELKTNTTTSVMPLDLSLERDKVASDVNTTSDVTPFSDTKQAILKVISGDQNSPVGKKSSNVIGSPMEVVSQPMRPSGSHPADVFTGASLPFERNSSPPARLRDAPKLNQVAGSKRAISDRTKIFKQDAKPNLTQVANEYARQQQMFGLTGLPVKRKRGRPRKYTTLTVFQTPPATRSPQHSGVSTARNSMPSFSYTTATPGSQPIQSATTPTIASSTVMPTLSIYTPLTVGAPLPGLYSAGLLLPGPNMPLTSLDTSAVTRTDSPVTGNVDSSSTSYTLAMTVSSQHSGSTEPAIARSPQALDSTPQHSNSSPSSAPPGLLADQNSSSYDVCSAHTLSGMNPCVDSFVGSNVPTCSVTSSTSVCKFSGSSVVPGWCNSSGTSTAIPTAFCMSPHVYLDPSRPAPSVMDVCQSNSGTDFPINSFSGRSELDLMTRLLPQATAALRASKGAGLSGPHSWNVDMVGSFIGTLPGCKQFAPKFTENEIDGAALLCLEQHDLMQILGMKLGPAVKVAGAIQTLRRSLMATPISELHPEYAGAMAAAVSCFNSGRLTASSQVDNLPSDESERTVTPAPSGHPSQRTPSTEDAVSSVA
ncbi:hypothetical protein CRM22_006514 [Opisthorchis felineus]|nr:hypothetical protein CRM22_006514 [Opisthorchis felineus]